MSGSTVLYSTVALASRGVQVTVVDLKGGAFGGRAAWQNLLQAHLCFGNLPTL